MKFLFLITMIFLGRVSIAQSNSYFCTYSTNFNRNFGSNEKVIQVYSGKLFIGNNYSSFFTIATEETKAIEIENDNQFLSFEAADTMFKVEKFPSLNLLTFYDKSFTKKTSTYLDTLYPMNWVITSEKKKIDSLECLKATTFFKGRNYICWYCPSIAIPNGPWKLGGLPGLIIEAYDENKDLVFLLKDFKSIGENEIPAYQIPNLNQMAGYPDYVNKAKKFITNLKEKMRAQPSNCLECQVESKITLHSWENIFN